MCEDTDTAVRILTEELTGILDVLVPVRTIQMRARYAPWLTKETKLLLKERDASQHADAVSGSQDSWRLYKNLRNAANSVMKNEKKKWEQQRLKEQPYNPLEKYKNLAKLENFWSTHSALP